MLARPPALQLVIVYKLARSAISGTGAVIVAALMGASNASALDALAASAPVVELSALWGSPLGPQHAWVAVTALALHAALMFAEGWGLHCGVGWASWLIVGAAASLLPFELVALVGHPAWGRALLLAINLLIVGYLVWLRAQRSSPFASVARADDRR